MRALNEQKKACVTALAAGKSAVLQRTLVADTETPVSAYGKLRPIGAGTLLESVEGGENWARYSIIGLRPRRHLRVLRGGDVILDGTSIGDGSDPFETLRSVTHPVELVNCSDMELPRFVGGWVGYLGYGAVHWIESTVPDNKPGSTPFPDAQFFELDTIILFDNVRHTMSMIAVVHPQTGKTPESLFEAAVEQLLLVESTLSDAPNVKLPTPQGVGNDFHPAQTQDSFEAAVARLRDAILAGDAIQIVLSQRFYADYDGDPFTIYRALRLVNPSPYLFFMEFPEGSLIGSSPEVLVRKQGDRAALRPIAGTRKRGANDNEDTALAADLLADPKEVAEHVMLVDLGRNDLGRVSRPGSVCVNEQMVIEKYSHVMHIVSNVESKLQKDCDAWALLRATFPAGTVSGAPKVKAMQLIEEVEEQRRGPYSGAVGYIDYRGDMDTGIMIRTICAWENRLMLQAGAGIVADSNPHAEYQETLNKAGALFEAVKLAQRGLEVDG